MCRTLEKDIMRKNIFSPEGKYGNDSNEWVCYDIVNCYSYAIGLLYDIEHLNPGEISGKRRRRQYTDEELLENVKSDMQVLGITMRESTLEEVVDERNAWKIAVMNTGVMNDVTRYDYHFLKQCSNGRWYQKIPYDQFPTEYDSRSRIITNPEDAKYPYNYHLVGYFVICKVEQI